jgi:hypothetical protein
MMLTYSLVSLLTPWTLELAMNSENLELNNAGDTHAFN